MFSQEAFYPLQPGDTKKPRKFLYNPDNAAKFLEKICEFFSHYW